MPKFVYVLYCFDIFNNKILLGIYSSIDLIQSQVQAGQASVFQVIKVEMDNIAIPHCGNDVSHEISYKPIHSNSIIQLCHNNNENSSFDKEAQQQHQNDTKTRESTTLSTWFYKLFN